MDLRTSIPVIAQEFAATGACQIEGLLAAETVAILDQYVRLQLASGHLPLETERSDAHAVYGDPLAESLFTIVTPHLGELVSTALPSYGYIRVYTAGSDLAPHADRAGCDLTLTMPLAGMNDGLVWAIYAQTLGGDTIECTPRAGSGVLLRGREVRHWREPLRSGWAAYAFLHWVDGAHAELRFDGRPGLGFSSRLAAS